MDEFGIRTSPVRGVYKPLGSNLLHIALETTMGAFYGFPDLTQKMLDELMRSLSTGSDPIIARNISDATLVIPRRIISKLFLVHGGDEAGRSEIWRAE